eukprot:10861545-Ditylum_brightwellii.AAC.1
MDMVDKRGELSLVKITGYRWEGSGLQLRYLLSTEETQWVDTHNAKTDHPWQTAHYIVDKYNSQQRNSKRDQWAKRS